jgi:hypothetical protein
MTINTMQERISYAPLSYHSKTDTVLIKIFVYCSYCTWLGKNGHPSASLEIDSIRNLDISICLKS